MTASPPVKCPRRPSPRPPAESLTQFVNGLSAALTAYERTVATERGRAGLRRLNAYEYENAIRDLLNVPWVQIKSKLPQDGEAWRYNKIGTALDVSHVQLARYMSSADYALREAMAAKLVQPPTSHHSHLRAPGAHAAQLPAARRQHPHRPPELPRPRFARSAGRPRRPQPHLESGNQRARGRRPCLQHLLRCRRI